MRVVDAHHTGGRRAAEVVRDDLQATPRRIVRLRVERKEKRGAACVCMHRDDEARLQHFLDERHKLFGNAPKNDQRIR